MVDRIGSGSELARAAIEAARKSHEQIASELTESVQGFASQLENFATSRAGGKEDAMPTSLIDGIEHMDAAARNVESLPLQMISGEVSDFHEIALQLKQSEMSFKFAMEIRNKLIDAYREVMRMGV